ncbi:MAG: MerR family transcriptional regulator [Actinobacteria bacterium]|nr:MAG: MerR family transcriptional regulator [Actinomycetota bacterium]
MTDGTLRIGEVAERAGVSCRTLRYYEELRLLAPSGHSAGGARRYTEEDVGRLLRIRELQEVMGFDLEEIGAILGAEDRLAELRSEWHGGARPERQEEILAEAVKINDRLRQQVREKRAKLDEVMADLEAKARRYRELARRSKTPG